MGFDKNILSTKIQRVFPAHLAMPFYQLSKEVGIWQKGSLLLKIQSRLVRFVTGIYLSYANEDFLKNEKDILNACSYESWVILLISLIKNPDIKLPEWLLVSPDFTDVLNKSLNLYKQWFTPENYTPENKDNILSTIDELEKITYELSCETEKFGDFYVVAPLMKEGDIKKWLLYSGISPYPPLISPIWSLPPQGYTGGVLIFKEGDEMPHCVHPFMVYRNVEETDSIYLHNILISGKPFLYESPSSLLSRNPAEDTGSLLFKEGSSIIGQLACIEHFSTETFNDMKKGFLKLKAGEMYSEFLFTHYLLEKEDKKKMNILKELMEVLREFGKEDIISKISDMAYKISEGFEKEAKLEGNLQVMEEVFLERLEFSYSPEQKFRDLLKLSNLYEEHLRNEEGAFYCLIKALEIKPSDDSVREHLLDAAERLNKWDELASEIEKIGKRAKTSEAENLFTEAGIIYGKKLNNPDLAEKSFLEALKINEKNINSLRGLAHIYEEAGKLKKFVDVQRKRLKFTEDIEEKVEILQTTLIAYRILNDKKGMEWTLKELLGLNPENEEAIKQSISLLYDSKEYSQLEGLYCDLLKKVINPELRIYLYEGLASLRANILGAKAGAKDAYEVVISYKGDNLEALKFLEKYYLEEGINNKYIVVQRKLIELSEGEEKYERALKLSDFYIEKMDDPYGALGIIEIISREYPERIEPLQQIEKIYLKLKMWNELRILYNRMLSIVPENKKIAIRLKMANLYWKELYLSENATEQFWEVLKEEELNEEAVKGLKEIYEKSENWNKMLALLDHIVNNSKDDSEKVKCLLEASKIYKDKFEDYENSNLYLEKAAELSPLEEEIALNLAEIYSKKQKWEKIVPLLEPVVIELEKKGHKMRSVELRKFIANAALNQGDKDRAIAEYEIILKEKGATINISLKLAQLYVERGMFPSAENIVSVIVKEKFDELKIDEKVQTYSILTDIAISKRRFDEAGEYLKKISESGLELNKDFYKKMLEVAKGGQDFGNVVFALKKLYPFEEDVVEKFAILLELADTLAEKLQKYGEALEIYKEAMKLKPDSKTALHRILETSIKIKDFITAKDTLIRIINFEEDGKRKSSYHYAVGLLARDNLFDRKLSKFHFKEALVTDPANEQSFRDLEAMYIEDKEYNELAELYNENLNYYKTINNRKKIEGLTEKLLTLYQENLNNIDKATYYLEKLYEIRPEDNKLLERLAHFYEMQVGKRKKAVTLYRNILKKYPLRYELYRKIKDILEDEGNLDKLWCATGILSVIGKAKGAEKIFYDEYKSPALRLKKDRIPPDLYKECILSSQEDPVIGRVFHILTKPIVSIVKWKTEEELSLKKENLVDLNKKGLFNDLTKVISRLFGITPPPIYYAEERMGLVKVALNPPSLVVGEDYMKEKKGKELRFSIAKLLTTFFPEHLLAGIVDAKVLKDFFLASLSFCFENYAFEGLTPEIKGLGKEVSAILEPGEKAELKRILDLFLKEREQIDIVKWMNGVEFTANHIGLFIANDIEVAVSVLRQEPVPLSSLTDEEKILELIHYAISEEFFKLRSEMGISIEAAPQKK